MSAPLPWCARLAAVDDDALGTALRDLAASWRPRLRGLVEILHARVSEPGDAGVCWWLHVGMVFERAPTEAPEDTALGRAVQLLVERHTHVWGVLHHYRPGDRALARYHRAPEGHPVPTLPPLPVCPWLAGHEGRTSKSTSPAPAKVPTKPAPAPQAAAPTPPRPSTQGSLFG